MSFSSANCECFSGLTARLHRGRPSVQRTEPRLGTPAAVLWVGGWVWIGGVSRWVGERLRNWRNACASSGSGPVVIRIQVRCGPGGKPSGPVAAVGLTGAARETGHYETRASCGSAHI